LGLWNNNEIKQNECANEFLVFSDFPSQTIMKKRIQLIKETKTNNCQLDLSSIGVKSIETDEFRGLSHLKTLNLSNNGIERLEAYAFRGLASLEYLYLQNNKIEQIDKKAFVGLPTYAKIIMGYSVHSEENIFHLI